MSRKILAALVGAAIFLGCAGQANALTVVLNGVVTGGSGSDGVIHVGDSLKLTATINNQALLPVGPGLVGFGTYQGVGPSAPGASLSITLDSYTWHSSDNAYDGSDFAICSVNNVHLCQGGPAIILSGNHVTEIYTVAPLLPSFSSRPELTISSNGAFSITNTFDYGNTSLPQNYFGSFDLANAQVTGIPEPAAWAMMLTGFFALGAALRRRRAGLAAADIG